MIICTYVKLIEITVEAAIYIAGVSIILWCHALYTQHYEKVRSKRERGERERGEGREGERGGGERETERDRENIIMSN